jgi:hypothetical protein
LDSLATEYDVASDNDPSLSDASASDREGGLTSGQITAVVWVNAGILLLVAAFFVRRMQPCKLLHSTRDENGDQPAGAPTQQSSATQAVQQRIIELASVAYPKARLTSFSSCLNRCNPDSMQCKQYLQFANVEFCGVPHAFLLSILLNLCQNLTAGCLDCVRKLYRVERHLWSVQHRLQSSAAETITKISALGMPPALLPLQTSQFTACTSICTCAYQSMECVRVRFVLCCESPALPATCIYHEASVHGNSLDIETVTIFPL